MLLCLTENIYIHYCFSNSMTQRDVLYKKKLYFAELLHGHHYLWIKSTFSAVTCSQSREEMELEAIQNSYRPLFNYAHYIILDI